MQYQTAYKLSIIPAAILLLLSSISIALTAVYWILGDWKISRWIPIPVQTQYLVDNTIIYYTESDTNATIVSGCLNLTAATVAVFVWCKLKQKKLDTDFHSPLRRFYVITVMVLGATGAISALTALVFHYTAKGDDQFGCTSTTGRTFQTPAKGIPFTNLYCTREMAHCNIQKPMAMKYKALGPMSTTAACNMAVAVKWLQMLLVLNGLVLMAMFFFQARLRRATRNRWSLHSNPEKNNHQIQT